MVSSCINSGVERSRRAAVNGSSITAVKAKEGLGVGASVVVKRPAVVDPPLVVDPPVVVVGFVVILGSPAAAKHGGCNNLKHLQNSDSQMYSENNVCFLLLLLLQSGCASEMPWLVTTDILTAHFTH